jgi:hypothetical protein
MKRKSTDTRYYRMHPSGFLVSCSQREYEKYRSRGEFVRITIDEWCRETCPKMTQKSRRIP